MGEWDQLLTERPNDASARLDTMRIEEILRLMNAEDAGVASAVAQVIPEIAAVVESSVIALKSGGRMLYVGAGTSGRLGVLDASECPPTFGVDRRLVQAVIAGGAKAVFQAVEEAEDRAAEGERDIRRRRVEPRDMVIGISASGTTPYVLGALKAAKAAGARTAMIACNRRGAVPCADVLIAPLVGPEVLTGSTRLKAGTAQKMILNMISTASMVRLGKVYRNLMVDMRPSNRKLHDRAARIVRMATGKGDSEVEVALAAAGGEMKTAIVMLETGADAAEARHRLAESGGIVHRAVTGPDGEA